MIHAAAVTVGIAEGDDFPRAVPTTNGDAALVAAPLIAAVIMRAAEVLMAAAAGRAAAAAAAGGGVGDGGRAGAAAAAEGTSHTERTGCNTCFLNRSLKFRSTDATRWTATRWTATHWTATRAPVIPGGAISIGTRPISPDQGVGEYRLPGRLVVQLTENSYLRALYKPQRIFCQLK